MQPATCHLHPATRLATQRKLILADVPSVTLATVETARQLLPGHDEDDILSLIEEGNIRFAWDIAIDPGRSAREWRIYPPCIIHCRDIGPAEDFPLTLPAVLAKLLPGDKPYFHRPAVSLMLNCSPTHVLTLIERGILALLPDTTYGRGRGNHALITHASLAAFFGARLEGGL